MKLSIVSTLYQSSSYIADFHQRISTTASQLTGDDYEIIFVNDGSPDNSLELVVQLAKTDPHVVVVDLSRNFGHHKAIMTGLDYANGEMVFLIDSDLEEEPEWLLSFSEQLQRETCDVVYGVQESRKGGWFERFSGKWFYYLFAKITGMEIPPNMVTARLMTRRYIDALLMHRERELFLGGLFLITGFHQQAQHVEKLSTSETTYTLKNKLSLLINSVTSFSASPLIGIFYFGIITSVLAGSYSAYLIIRWLVFSNTASGWTSVIVSIWLFGGLISFFIGVVGIYLSKVFSETKLRPYTIVKRVYGRDKSSNVN
ncbi:MAG: glycosyltransferase family 2 protein [Thiotrichaceae bacterium]|nr:glycosyltransferase family 2 protein [Thiotrichaceae bacterium]PCI14865.1 MAG: glycosyl transferase [Thiotrichales bacterium]